MSNIRENGSQHKQTEKERKKYHEKQCKQSVARAVLQPAHRH